MNKAKESRRRHAVGSLIAVALGLLASSFVGAQDRDRCLRVELPGPVVLPDGTTGGSSQLRICLDRAISPAISLHRLYLDGYPVGQFLGRSRDSKDTAEDPVVVFARAGPGAYRLVEYAWPQGHTTRIHVFRQTPSLPSGASVTKPVATPRAAEEFVAVVARRE